MSKTSLYDIIKAFEEAERRHNLLLDIEEKEKYDKWNEELEEIMNDPKIT